MDRNVYKTILIKWARTKYGNIRPCGSTAGLWDCFSEYGDDLLFWFNDTTASTRIISFHFFKGVKGGVIRSRLNPCKKKKSPENGFKQNQSPRFSQTSHSHQFDAITVG